MLNLDFMRFYTDTGAPTIDPVTPDILDGIEKYVSLADVGSVRNNRICAQPEKSCVHFYLDDYRFERVWNHPQKYADFLAPFAAVCSPDFSLYTDMPYELLRFNNYRRHWCGAFWQSQGMTVIPTISWALPDSYEWCFDGDPVGGLVTVSSVGTQNAKGKRALFNRGYKEMLTRLEPSAVLFFGNIPEDLPQGGEKLVHVDTFYEKFTEVKQ